MLAGNVVFIRHSISPCELKTQIYGYLAPCRAFRATPFSTAKPVRRPQIRELAEQIDMRTYFVSRHFPICEDREEDIDGIVSECSAIVREGRRAPGIVGQDVRQQCRCHP